jgi:[acyl-carrier-protein] S-malonyltransferase
MGAEVVAFPGQGVDPVDLARVLEAHRDDRRVAHLRARLGRNDLHDLDLTDTRVAQPAILTAGLLAADDELSIGSAAAVVGHSFGEITALAFAGALDHAAAVDLVALRAELCHAEHERRPGQMVVVMRLDPVQVEWLRRQAVARTGGSLEIAVVNGPGQVVLSGDRDAAAFLVEAVTALDAVARPLAIGGAYHSPLLEAVVDPFTRAVAEALSGPPEVPLVSCTTQARLQDVIAIAEALGRALVLPVSWPATLEALLALGVTDLVDTGPGRTLVNLARYQPTLACRGLSPERARQRA